MQNYGRFWGRKKVWGPKKILWHSGRYQGAPDTEVTRAVQRLALLVPVDKEDEVVDKEDEPEE